MQSITIEKAIAHEVVKYKSLVDGYSPEYSDQLMPLTDRKLKGLIESRLNQVLGSGSHSVEMEIDKAKGVRAKGVRQRNVLFDSLHSPYFLW